MCCTWTTKKWTNDRKLKESFESCVVLENLFEKRNNETTSKNRMSETKNCVVTLLNANGNRHGQSLYKWLLGMIQLNHPGTNQYISYVQHVQRRNIPGEGCLHWQKMRTLQKTVIKDIAIFRHDSSFYLMQRAENSLEWAKQSQGSECCFSLSRNT